MKYYSTNRKCNPATLAEAVIRGLAPDRGLYMPERIGVLPESFFDGIGDMSLSEISCRVADELFGEDVPAGDLHRIVTETLSFPIPLRQVAPDIYALELYHGPTAAFKDVGARFMARMLSYFISREGGSEPVTVLVATSGDTGSAVANGFYGVEGIDVAVLYPRGKVSPLQEKQFATLGGNITAIEIDGSFDDCQRLVKSAFMDPDLTARMRLTSANSINVARFLPQSFYYFGAYASLRRAGCVEAPVISVPSGNFGNLAAGLIAHRMGLPVRRFIAANNRNKVFCDYLASGSYQPRSSVATIANAMDVGDPSNFARIADLYGNDVERIRGDISASFYDDSQIEQAIGEVYRQYGYVMDPHGACGYMALKDTGLGGPGIFLETAHPAKFAERVEPIVGKVVMPPALERFAVRTKNSIPLSAEFDDFKEYLLSR